MSLPSVEWRYVGTNSATSATINTIMDNIYSLATGITYIDGSPRSQGSGSAGSWGRYQTPGGITEAIYVTPPSGNQKIIIAGSSGTFTPTMASPDTYNANTLMVNITKNPGNFSTWDSANPFTSGNAFGYWRWFGGRTSSTPGNTSFTGNIYLYESKESIAAFLINSTTLPTGSYSNGFFAGALCDPESTSTADTETDGRLYGLITSGHYVSTAPISSSWNSSTTDTIWEIDWFNSITNISAFITHHSTSIGFSHAGCFNPGTGTIKPIDLMMYPLTSNASSSLITPSGKFARVPLLYRYKNTNQIVGRLREVSLCQRGLIGQRHMNGTSTIGYVISCSDYAPTTADAILLEY